MKMEEGEILEDDADEPKVDGDVKSFECGGQATSEGTRSRLGEHPFKGPESDTRVTDTVNSTLPRLFTIEYIDLAEQYISGAPDCLRASNRLPVPECLRASRGADDSALLSRLLIDNSPPYQCVTSFTAANVCKKPTSDAVDFVMEIVPLLTKLLRYHEERIKGRSNCSKTVYRGNTPDAKNTNGKGKS
ncbi:hypothetical protein Tco_1265876 [Tanacetum coccineum]